MRTTAHSDRLLNHFYRNTSFAAPTTVYAALFTAVTDLEAGTVTETTYGSYARQAITFGAPGAALNGRQIANSGVISFPAKSDAGSVTLIATAVYDAVTAGNLFDINFLDPVDPFIATVDDITADTFEAPAHGLLVDQRVRLESIPGSGALPGAVSLNTDYFLVTVTTDDFQLSLTQGGAAINITSIGRCLVCAYDQLVINQNDAPQFATGVFKLTDD
jgi:hypothetical protein